MNESFAAGAVAVMSKIAAPRQGPTSSQDTNVLTMSELLAIRDPAERRRYMADMSARNQRTAMPRASTTREAVVTQKTAGAKGALVGAALGAATGAATGEEGSRARRALVGAGLGGAAGAGAQAVMKSRAKTKAALEASEKAIAKSDKSVAKGKKVLEDAGFVSNLVEKAKKGRSSGKKVSENFSPKDKKAFEDFMASDKPLKL